MNIRGVAWSPFLIVLLAVVGGTPQIAVADSGDPIAIRRVKGGYSIETMWNLSVQVVTADSFVSGQTEGVDLIRHPVPYKPAKNRKGQPAVANAEFDRMLDRAANAEAITWSETSDVEVPSTNAIRVRAAGPVLVIEVDGVRITYVDHGVTELSPAVGELTANTDVLIVGPGQGPSKARELIASRVSVVGSDDATLNTLAVRAGELKDSDQPIQVKLTDRPLVLPRELENLMAVKEAACRRSQATFRELSIRQMNFRPSNGSHTPRWNSEHLMGRELLFFSQIFHAQDPSLPVIDLNPAQMPTDYTARHPDWTGAEEARQMERVTAFTRRFAHLLKDLPLNQKPPGSTWSVRGLLRQMNRHYGEHTANVKKKFELADWPDR